MTDAPSPNEPTFFSTFIGLCCLNDRHGIELCCTLSIGSPCSGHKQIDPFLAICRTAAFSQSDTGIITEWRLCVLARSPSRNIYTVH
jgi:hypothetical protein